MDHGLDDSVCCSCDRLQTLSQAINCLMVGAEHRFGSDILAQFVKVRCRDVPGSISHIRHLNARGGE
jgi:hypothetical protein